MVEVDNEQEETWLAHWRESAARFTSYAQDHREDVWHARAPAASTALVNSIAALTPARRTTTRAFDALCASGYEAAWLVCDAFYAREKSPGDLIDWLLGWTEAADPEPGDGPRPMIETSTRRAALEALHPLAARYDLSKSRGRTMRPVAPGIAGSLLHAATDQLLELAAAAARVTFEFRR